MTYNLDLTEGLIPAWAGKTWSPRVATTGTWAHPRVGGENCTYSHRVATPVGSSPRGRGKLDGDVCDGVG